MQPKPDETLTVTAETGKQALNDVHEEAHLFKKLQHRFIAQFEKFFPDKKAPKTVVVIPSLSMDTEILSKISGITHYEERLLCLFRQ